MAAATATLLSKLQSQKALMREQVGGGQFGVYAYLREKDSATGRAGTPYYIGKMGYARRPWEVHTIPVPADVSRVRLLKGCLTEEEANAWERSYIKRYGRADQGSGILRNLTDGGEGASGMSEKTRAKIKVAIEPAKREAAKKYGISYEKWEALSPEDRSLITQRYCLGKRGAELFKNRVSFSDRASAAAEKYGFTIEEWASLSASNRNVVMQRYGAGKRKEALRDGRNPRLLAAASKFDVPYERWAGLSAKDRSVVRTRHSRGGRGAALLCGL